jgi:hypothetical protein
MRFKSIILALNLSALAATSHAQLLTPAKPAVGAPATSAIPVTAAAQAPVPASPAQAGSLAPGVVSLSDVAKQSGSEPARAPAAVQPTPVPAITVADGTGQPIELARDKMRPGPGASLATNSSPFRLIRISRVGGEDTAVIWIKGQNRKVTTGSRVLQYAVGDIKEDGVCLYPVKGKVKDKCKSLLTFQGM